MVSQVAEQMITKIREREQEAITALDNTRTLRMEKLNAVMTQIQSLVKQLNQAVHYANNLVKRSSSSDIMQSKGNLEKRFEDLNNNTSSIVAHRVSSFVKFVPTAEPGRIFSLGFFSTKETDLNRSTVEGLAQDFQTGVESELAICPQLISEAGEAQGKFHVKVLVEPAEQVTNLMTCKKEDGSFQTKFTPQVPGTYNIQVIINGDNLYEIPFTVHVKERQLKVVGELDLKGETLQNPDGIAVNSKGLIAVTDWNGHCILIFNKEGEYLRKFGCNGENIGKLNRPSGLTYLDDDHILVAD